MKKIIVVHPTGNQNVRNLLKSLIGLKCLYSFYTSVAIFKKQFLYRLTGISFLKELRRRTYQDELAKLTVTTPWKELGRIVAEKFKLHRLTMHETGIFSIDAMYNSVDKSVARRIQKIKDSKVGAIYIYEDCGLNIEKIAEQKKWKILYELPTGYWRASKHIFEENKKLMSPWAESFIGLQDSDKKLTTKDLELSKASHIIVASTFVANTLKLYPKELPPVHIIPYGFPEPFIQRVYQPIVNRKLKLFYIGRLTQQKGIGNLFEAVDQLSDFVELTIVGKITKDIPILNNYLKKYNYIPSLSHKEILELMRTQDVMVFPSLFEGFGLVVTESMSQGTPVITTTNTCGPDFIDSEKNGWIVPFGDTKALTNQIRYLIDHPEEIIKNGKAAMLTAKERPWRKYEEELSDLIIKLN